MGKGSTATSGVPTFRTGNIRTPADPRVTERKGVPATFVAADPLTTPTNVPFWYGSEHGPRVAQRESLAIENANATPTAPVQYVTTHGEMTAAMTAANVRLRYVMRGGKMVPVAVERTVDMGDDALPIFADVMRMIAAEAEARKGPAKPARKGKGKATVTQSQTPEEDADKAERRASRERDDRHLLAYLRSKGYTGTLTSDIRSLALDALAHAVTVGEYAAEVKASNKGKHYNGK